MNKTIPVPTALACAVCGKPVDCLSSYGVTTPTGAPVEPRDLCSLDCLARWAAAHARAGHA